MRPPTVQELAFDEYNFDSEENMPYSTIIYVPAECVNAYKMHDYWGLYDVRPLGAQPIETDEVKVEPTASTANVAWPSVSGAVTYELVIKDKSGNVVCTLTFNVNGQLTSIAFAAPSRDNAPQQTQAAGFSFTVTGFDAGIGYNLTITAKDNNNAVIETFTSEFRTLGESSGSGDGGSDQPSDPDDQALDQITNNQSPMTNKVIKDGRLLILRDGRTYTLTGQEVK